MKHLHKVGFFALLIFTFVTSVQAQTVINPRKGSENYYNSITGTSIAVDSLFTVYDDQFYDSTWFSLIEQTYSVKGNVFFEWIPRDSIVINMPFDISLDLEIVATDSSNTDSTYYHRLTVIHDTVPGQPFQHRDIFKLNNYYKIKVKILAVLINSDSISYNDILESVELSSTIEVDRSYRFNCSDQADVNHDYLSQSDELEITWSDITGATEYDLEWTFYDDSTTLSKALASTSGYDFYHGFFNNSTRVNLSDTKYNTSLVYPSGFLLYRVRGVQVLPSGQRITTVWSHDTSDYYRVIWHEDSLNWQSSISFAEEGKRKQVVTYLDGTLRDHQTVTKNNTLNIDLVASTLYDHYGRKAMNILPSPIDSSIIMYFESFNKLSTGFTYTKADFDTGGCGFTPPLMDSTSGASRYYSSNNEFMNSATYVDDLFNQFIPKAYGFVYGITQYTQDNTNRISRQSSPGSVFNLGTDHNTKYYYAKASQPEIDRLFGNDVGFEEYYNKNMVVDANGQPTITYIDDKGRTIATALAGASPDNLMPLNSNLTPDTITFSLLGNNQITNSNEISSTYTLLVPEEAEYFFEFEQTPLADSILNCDTIFICYDCMYDLEINITGACDEDISPLNAGLTFPITLSNLSIDSSGYLNLDTLCNSLPDAIVDTFTLGLKQGTYHISKTLRISQAAMELYKEKFMRENTCKSLEDYQNQFQNEINFEGCQVDCESCMSAIGDSASYVSTYLNNMVTSGTTPTADDTTFIIDDYFNNLSVCQTLCDPEDLCLTYFETMLADISPGGQYFIYLEDTVAGTFTAPDQASVLYSDYQGITYNYPNGNPITVEYNGNQVSPAVLPLQEYIEGFQESWAINLVRAHPEYCFYLYCKEHNDANLFVQNMLATDDFFAALDSGYLNPSSASALGFFQDTTDLLFTGPHAYSGTGSEDYIEDVNDTLLNYFVDTGCDPDLVLNIWQLAYSVVDTSYDPCTDPFIDTTWTSLCNGDYNMFWHLVRSYYLGIRTAKYYEVWGLYAENNNCCNNCIGTAINTLNLNQNGAGGITYTDTFPCSSSQFCPPRNYSHKRKIFHNIQVVPGTIPTDLSGGTTAGNAGLEEYCANICYSYWQEIYEIIQNCGIAVLPGDTSDLIDAFACVCESGCDLEHTIGSNNIPSGAPACTLTFQGNTYPNIESFEDIFAVLGFTPGDTICNPYLLALPPPYDSPVNFGQSIIFDTIPPCICSKLDTLYHYYDLVDSAGVPTFTSWLNTQMGSSLLEEQVEYMMDRCDSTLDSCDFPLGPFEIPTAMECEYCVFCDSVMSVADEFFSDYPAALALNDFYNLFTNYMNHHIGFNLTHTEYLDFLIECGYVWPSPDCNDLQLHVANYFDSLAVDSIRYIDLSLYLNHYLDQFYTLDQYQVMFERCGITIGTLPDTLDPNCVWLEHAVDNYLIHHGGSLTPDTYSDLVLMIMNQYSNVYTNISDLLTKLEQSCDSTILPTMNGPVDCDTLNSYFSSASSPPPSVYFQLNDDNSWNYTYMDYVCWFHFCGNPYDTLPVLDCYEIDHEIDYFGDSLQLTNVPYVLDSLVGWLMNHYVYAFSEDSLLTYIDSICGRPLEVSGSCDSLQIAVDAWLPYAEIIPINVFINGYYNLNYSLSAYELWLEHCRIPINIICNRPILPDIEITDNCDSTLIELANSAATVAYEQYLDSLINEFEDHYLSNCLQTMELFTCKAPLGEYHYTLYYYDQAGNLIRTVPPEGINFLNATQIANANLHRTTGSAAVYGTHDLYTEYFYNSFNKVHKQITPDAGTSQFWYDLVGRLVVSQNAQQKLDTAYSYTMFDNLSRLIESGRIKNTTAMSDAIAEDTSSLMNYISTSSLRTEVTHTLYDEDLAIGFTQENLRNRVGAVVYQDSYDGSLATYASGLHYSYDILGNVALLINERPNLSSIGHDFKTVNYKYDLVSGNVNEVIYQKGFGDQFIHHYKYDADNRLTEVYTTTDESVWDIDGRYRYYYHGPLARIELGTYSVQGIDHFYSLQGWLKGKNASVSNWSYDMFNDGDTIGPNTYISYDALSFTLNYFNNDYTHIGSANAPEASDPTNIFTNSSPNLYNGNIRSAIYSINEANQDYGYAYSYDQLNRYRNMDVYSDLDEDPNQWGSDTDTILKYHENVNYDANGNITKYLRHGDNATKIQMDSMNYYYYSGKNQLKYVTDSVPAVDYADIDIDNQSNNNYTYDANGNLVSDIQEGLTIDWYNNGKIKHILNDTTDIEIFFYYDPMGRRIEKKVVDSNSNDTTKTLYALDAQGNTLALYEYKNSDSLWLKDFNIYGSSRIGQYSPDSVIYCDSCLNNDTIIPVLTMGDKQYELTNHLGNVMTTISDKKIFQLISASVYTWKPEILSWQDYYPFGMMMPGRKYDVEIYRFGFNVMGKDDEVKGTGNSYDFGARIYDPRIGRWLSIDPLFKKYPYQSPFSFALDNPILFKDYNGRDIEIRNNGEVFVYTGSNTTYSGANEFITQTVLALNHLRAYEAETNAQYKVITQLADDRSVVAYVEEVGIHERADAAGPAKWNPKQGTYVTDAKTGKKGAQNAAGTLLHELGHKYDDFYKNLSEQLPKYPTEKEIFDYSERSEKSPYGNFLEEGVIPKVENPYYQWMGQSTRKGHENQGFFEVTGDFTSNTECTTCGTLNIEQKEIKLD